MIVKTLFVVVVVFNSSCADVAPPEQTTNITEPARPLGNPPDTRQENASPGPIPQSGILFYDGHSFIVSAPEGWHLDTEAGASQGLAAVFYPENSTWKSSNSVMYARIVDKPVAKRAFQDFVHNDVESFKRASSRSTVTNAKPISTKDGKPTVVEQFYDGNNENYEMVAYVEESQAIVVLALSARTRAEFDRNVAAFEKLVESYSYIGERIYQ
jgi:hypothetical protein